MAAAFPAMLKDREPSEPAHSTEELASNCFYHDTKPAVGSCSYCGRFLCSLCQLDVGENRFCPNCLRVGKTKGKIKNLENYRDLPDSMALDFAVLPFISVIFTAFSLLTAVIALWLTIRSWNRPTSIVRRTRVRLYFAGFFSIVQIVGWTAIFFTAYTT